MDWATYKSLCDRPDYWSRWMLLQTSTLLSDADEPALAQTLDSAIDNPALAKPQGHSGPEAADMFQLSLTYDDRAKVLAVVKNASELEATTTQGRGLGGFVEAWQEYASWAGSEY